MIIKFYTMVARGNGGNFSMIRRYWLLIIMSMLDSNITILIFPFNTIETFVNWFSFNEYTQKCTFRAYKREQFANVSKQERCVMNQNRYTRFKLCECSRVFRKWGVNEYVQVHLFTMITEPKSKHCL